MWIILPHQKYNQKLKESNEIYNWDIEENQNFVVMPNGFKVYNIGSIQSKTKAADLLYYIDIYIKLIQSSLNNNSSTLEQTILATTPMKVQETPYDKHGKKYHGICKPKEITTLFNKYKKGTDANSVRDNDCYCKHRLVMLQLRNKNGSLRSWTNIKETLLHELAHAMRNHLQYFEDENHLEDFDRAEQVLIDLSNMNRNLLNIDSLINKLYY